MRTQAADLAAQKTAAGAVAASSGAASVLADAKTLALELLGVPLPVVLLSAVGGFGARFFMPAVGFWAGLGGSAFWSVAGAGLSQVAAWGLGAAFGGQVPAGALGGIGMALAGVGVIAGARVPELVHAAIDAAGRRLRGSGGGGNNGGGHG